jgi:hypothetical protein
VHLVFPEETRELSIEDGLIADLTVINPFDFFVEESAEQIPFRYARVVRMSWRLPIAARIRSCRLRLADRRSAPHAALARENVGLSSPPRQGEGRHRGHGGGAAPADCGQPGWSDQVVADQVVAAGWRRSRRASPCRPASARPRAWCCSA